MKRRSPLAVLGWAALSLCAGCGKRGDPLPPLPRTPRPLSDFRAAQRGDQLEVSYTAPRLTTGGAPLPVLEVEVLRALRPGDFGKNAVAQSKRVAPGEHIVETTPLPPPGSTLRVAARVRAHGQVSALTSVQTLVILPLPPPPTALKSRLEQEGVSLAWTAPTTPIPTPAPAATPTPAASPGASPKPSPAASSTSSPSPGSASPSPGPGPSPTPTPTPTPTPSPRAPTFSVYRREPSATYGAPLGSTALAEPSYHDASVHPGEQWCYVVRTVVSADPLVESASSDETCVAVKDVFPPAAPTGVAVLEREGAVEVSWSPSPEVDLASYRVYRAAGSARPERLAAVPGAETVYRDAAPPHGALVYTVTAVDKDGNESPASLPASVRVP